jgi:uncharacterized protein involved in response to NO
MKFSSHPLWLVGFRPFFLLGCLAGISLPILWLLMFSGVLAAPHAGLTAVQWHAHEMFFGFGWAILGGFLLTSTKNWVGIRGYHGGALIFLAAAWLFERVGMWCGGSWPEWLFRLSNNLFLVSIVGMLIWTLYRHRDTDSYRDNYFFLLFLPAFILAKSLLLSGSGSGSGSGFAIGSSMAIALFRMSYLLMLERTLTQFMKGVFQVSILRNDKLDLAIKLIALVMIVESLLPPPLAAGLALLLAALLAFRFVFWQPQLAMRRIELAIMYLGYLAIVAQLLLLAGDRLGLAHWVGSVAVHTFTFGAMGLIAPAMVIRISKGHTGRKVVFEAADKAALWLMIVGLLARVVAPQFFPAAYPRWIDISATCWAVCFALLAWRYIPMQWRARIDGKEH